MKRKLVLYTAILLGALVLDSFSFCEKEHPFLNFSTEYSLKETMNFLSDSSIVVRNLGSDFIVKTGNSCLRTATGSTLTQTTSYCYSNLGLTISYVTTSNAIPNDDFSDIIVTSQYKNLLVNLDSTSEVAVYGYKMNKSKFGDLVRDSVSGKWVEHINDDGHYFSYVSKYVSFNSGSFTQERIDSLQLDYERTEEMNAFFEDKTINSMHIRDNDSFFYRIMH